MKEKRKLSFWEIWNMSFGFLGIQFGLALQNANTSRIFETLGAKVEDIPILWIAAPVTGLVVQPIIGYLSDRTWTHLGRRRPYFLVGAILASIGLCIMPNSPSLWIAAGTLWLMDASINISMEPFRAFVGDNLPSEQRTTGFAMQSFFIGVGAVVGSALPYILSEWLHISNTASQGVIPDSVKWSFYLGAFVFLSAVCWTVFTSKEYSPQELSAQENLPETSKNQPKKTENLRGYGIIFSGVGIALTGLLYHYQLEKELYILSLGLLGLGVSFLAAWLLHKAKRTENAFVSITTDMLHMPQTMKQLAVVQFFSWFALFSLWIYSTSAITRHFFHTTDPASELYNQGANWVTVLFAVYNAVAAVVAFLLPVMARKTSRKTTHLVALLCGGLGLISVYFFSEPEALILSMVGVGIAWASILAMPYAMLSGALPSHKMGYYMGVFNFFIVLPQIVAATVLGLLVKKFFNDDPVYAFLIGGASMILAGLLTLLVSDKAK